MIDPRNRPAFVGSAIVGLGAFVLLLWLGLPPIVAWMAGWTVPAFAMYGIDKRQAERSGWRVPEIALHALALVGGVIGAWIGRSVFHHKTAKPVFTLVLIGASIGWGAIAIWLLTR